MAKKPVKKKIVQKKTQVKKAVVKKPAPVKKVIAPPIPLRAPVKKVVNMPQIVKQVNPPVIEIKKIEEPKIFSKVAWNALPKYLPAQVRFLIQASKTECEKALGSPFPFAKFISSLPQTQCGLEFSFLFLGLEHELDAIAGLCRLNIEQVQKIATNASSNFVAKFSTECGEMYRKLKTQLTGSGVTVDSLTEQYLIQKVDRNFQIMLGAVILKSLGAKTINYQPTALAS
jgi:hypothetical protein